MPQRRRKPAPRPKQPARVRKAKTKKRRRRRGENTQRHPELWGLALVAAGVFLAAVLWLGWDGGVVGRGIERGLDRLVGAARLAFPPVLLLLVGGLLVVRSALVDVRPFRTGLAVTLAGPMTILDARHGGLVGEAVLGRGVGRTGTGLVGAFAVVAGAVLLTGASVGALVRHSARAARRTATAVRCACGSSGAAACGPGGPTAWERGRRDVGDHEKARKSG